ncbi:MAG: aminotransferase class IV [Solirubrobacterales bacterium]
MITYVNGKYVPEDEAKVPVQDRGMLFGDGVYDIERTFDGAAFKLEEHLDRLRKSMKYIELDGDRLIGTVRDATHEVLARNADAIRGAGDVWIHQVVTAGAGDLDLGQAGEPTVIVMLRPLEFGSFAPLYERGVDLTVSLLTRHFAGAVDPRVKSISRLAWARAERKATRMSGADPRPGHSAWTVIFNDDGTIAEAVVSNLCIATKDRIVRPPRYEALEGAGLETLCELAQGLGLGVEERKLGLYDLVNADATFMTGTSFSVLPVAEVDGIPLDRDDALYSRLLQSWIDLVGFDFVEQAKERAGL